MCGRLFYTYNKCRVWVAKGKPLLKVEQGFRSHQKARRNQAYGRGGKG